MMTKVWLWALHCSAQVLVAAPSGSLTGSSDWHSGLDLDRTGCITANTSSHTHHATDCSNTDMPSHSLHHLFLVHDDLLTYYTNAIQLHIPEYHNCVLTWLSVFTQNFSFTELNHFLRMRHLNNKRIKNNHNDQLNMTKTPEVTSH
jgi:hypothetical protein